MMELLDKGMMELKRLVLIIFQLNNRAIASKNMKILDFFKKSA